MKGIFKLDRACNIRRRAAPNADIFQEPHSLR